MAVMLLLLQLPLTQMKKIILQYLLLHLQQRRLKMAKTLLNGESLYSRHGELLLTGKKCMVLSGLSKATGTVFTVLLNLLSAWLSE
jgi:hypothetical protein